MLRITEIPFGTTTGALMDSIVAAADKGKIKIAKIEDNTAANADILVHLPAGADAETTRDALFAFTDCELSISPNACVIADGKPQFLGVSDILRRTTQQTRELLRLELEINLAELAEKWHFSSLEKIFIENRIYRDIEECETWEAVLKAIDDGLKPFKKLLKREVTAGRPRPPHRNQDQAHLQVRLLQGRRGNPRPGKSHRRNREKPPQPHQVHHPLVRGTRQEIRQGPRAPHRDRLVRPRGPHAGGRRHRDALSGCQKRLRRLRPEKGRRTGRKMLHHR